jgi:hypothetical protein
VEGVCVTLQGSALRCAAQDPWWGGILPATMYIRAEEGLLQAAYLAICGKACASRQGYFKADHGSELDSPVAAAYACHSLLL